MGKFLLTALVLSLGFLSNAFSAQKPFCVQGESCWPRTKDWASLAKQLQGEFVIPTSPIATCQQENPGKACLEALGQVKNPFYLQTMPGGFQSQGYWQAWQDKPSVYAIVAKNSEDVVLAVNFAREHHVKLAIKGAGHDYLGRNLAANGLLIWTRHLTGLKFQEKFVPVGCPIAQKGQPAVTFGAGERWIDVYNFVTTKHQQYVQGGGCTTVGAAGGFTQGGGFGSFSKKFGTGASGMLQAKVVVASGKELIANRCKNPDLFWAIKGGGGGTFGVVTEMTLITHPLPSSFAIIQGEIAAKTNASYKQLIKQFLLFYRISLNNEFWGEQFSFDATNKIKFALLAQGLSSKEINAAWEPLQQWLRKNKKQYSMQFKVISIPPQKMWDYHYWQKYHPEFVVKNNLKGAPMGQYWWAPNSGEVFKYWYTYQSHWLPVRLLQDDSLDKLSRAFFYASRLARVGVHINKGLAGASKEAVTRTLTTSTNPAVFRAGALIIMSAGSNQVYPGVKGREPNYASAKLQVKNIAKAMNYFRELAPNAGTYVNEADYFQKNWQQDFWGTNYQRLQSIKQKYDPGRLFSCHHCVGS